MTHTPNTDCGSLYVGDTVYFPESDTIEQVEDLRWVGSAFAQDVMVLTTDLQVRTVRFSTPVERVSRTHRRFAA